MHEIEATERLDEWESFFYFLNIYHFAKNLRFSHQIQHILIASIQNTARHLRS